nr:DUF815 domain-containing protein [Candidatus Phycosocius spiralis]
MVIHCDPLLPKIDLDPGDLELERSALQWSTKLGARSGRSAWQFIIERAGQLGRTVTIGGQGHSAF